MIGSKPNVSVDRIIWHLVKLFGSPCDYNLIRKCEKLIGFIGAWKPDMKILLKEKCDSLEGAIQGWSKSFYFELNPANLIYTSIQD